jgi:AraC-like DNA-binding protein
MKSKDITKINLPDCGVLVESRIERPDFGSEFHRHDYLSVIYIVSGKGTLNINGRSYELGPDSVVSLGKDQLHDLQDKPGNRMTVFSIYFDIVKTRSNKHVVDYLFQSPQPFNLPVYYAEQIRQSLRQILHEQLTRPPGYKLAIIQLFNLSILSAFRAKIETSKNNEMNTTNNSSARVRDALNYISKNSHEQFSLSDAAKIAKVSQRQFTNLCRKQMGKSFIRFLNQQRCDKARKLIDSTDMSVASIAFEVGYEELSTFYRAFKKFMNKSPLEYRKSKN